MKHLESGRPSHVVFTDYDTVAAPRSLQTNSSSQNNSHGMCRKNMRQNVDFCSEINLGTSYLSRKRHRFSYFNLFMRQFCLLPLCIPIKDEIISLGHLKTGHDFCSQLSLFSRCLPLPGTGISFCWLYERTATLKLRNG